MNKPTFASFAILLFFFHFISYSQVGIGTSNPDPNSILEIASTGKGVLLPRVNLLATNNANPMNAHVNGMLVYNINTGGSGIFKVTPGFYVNDGSKWIRLADELLITGVDKTNDEWLNASGKVELGKQSDGITARPAGTEFVVRDDGTLGIGLTNPSDKVTILANNAQGITITGGNHISRSITFDALANGGQGEINWRKSGNGALSASVRSVGSASWAVKGLGFFTGNFSDLTSDAVERMCIMPDGKVGIGIQNPSVQLEVSSTDAIRIPVGNSAQRPGTPKFGLIRYNTEIGRGEMYVNDVNGDGILGDAGWRPL